MSVVSVWQPWEATRSMSIDEKYDRTYTRNYQVISDNYLDNEFNIYSGIVASPYNLALFTPHESDPKAYIKRIQIDFTERCTFDGNEGAKWMASVEWGEINPYEASPDGNPLSRLERWSIEGVNGEEIVDVDIMGVPVVNTAYERFNPTIVRDVTRCTIKITKNYTGIDPSVFLAYANKLNSATWFGFPEKSVKCQQPRISGDYSMEMGFRYMTVEWTFDYIKETWVKKVASQGFRELVGGNWKEILIDGNPASDPVFLDSAGLALTPPIDASNINIQNFDIYEAIDFNSTFGFPTGLFTTP